MKASAVTSSPLSGLLHETKDTHRTLLQQRDYEAAQSLRDSCFERAAQLKAEMHAGVRRNHETERRRLLKAKQQALSQVHGEVVDELHRIEGHWSAKEDAHHERQHQRFEQFERTVRSREGAKPVVLSSYVRDLQQSEKRLADFHMYTDASVVRKKIQHREVEERAVAEAKREERVQKTLDLRRNAMRDEDSNFRAKVKNELQLAVFRATQEERRVRNKFSHIERDMAHAHQLELRKDPLQAPYQRPKFLRGGQLAQSDDSGIAAAAGHRGSEYLRRTQGPKLAVPSLCDMYRDGVPDELLAASNTTTVHDPVSATRVTRSATAVTGSATTLLPTLPNSARDSRRTVVS